MADIVKIIDSQQAFDDLTKLSSQLTGVQKQINEMAVATAKMNTSLSGLQSIANLDNRLKGLEESQKRVNTRMSESEKLERQLTAAKEKLALSSSQEYSDLIKTRKALTDKNKELRNSVDSADKATSSFSKLGSMVKSIVAAFGIVNGIQLFVGAIKDVFKLTTTLNSMDFAIKAVIKSETELAQTQLWLSKITNSFGAELVSTTNRYIKFRAASQQAGFSATETQKIFGTMTKAAGVLGLKTDELTGIYLALEQMISKGKITTEELRRQLGERLPGAMDIMAKSMGVTTSELDKMMKAGEVITKDVLPKFAEQVEKSFGIENIEKVDTLQAATIRLKNSWTELIQDLEGSKGTISSVFTLFINKATELLTIYSQLSNVLGELNTNSETMSEMSKAWSNVKDSEIGLISTIKKSIEAMDGSIKNYRERNNLIERGVELSLELSKGEMTRNDGLKLGAILTKMSTDELNAYIEALEKQAKLIGNDTSNEIIEGTVDWYRKLISENNKIIEQNKTKREQIIPLQNENKEYQKQIDLLLGVSKGKKQEIDYLEGSIGYLKKMIANNEQLIEQATDNETRTKYREENALLQIQLDLLAKARKLVENPLVGNRVGRDDGGDIVDKKPTTIIDKSSDLQNILDDINEFTDEYGDQINQAIDITNAFFDNRLERLAQDRDANEEYYDNLISLAEGNQEEQDRLEREKQIKDDELRKKQNEVAKKQAIFNKALSIAEISMKTAEAIAKSISASPLTGGLPWSAINAALGAAQIASVIAQPLPQFKDGKSFGNNYEGLAIVNDGGKTEYREDKLGNISAFKGVNTLTHVAKDDIIHKDLNALISSKGYNSDDIYKSTVMASLASDRGISTYRLEKVLDTSLKGLKQDLTDGIKKCFKNVNFNSYPKIDLGHVKFKNNTL